MTNHYGTPTQDMVFYPWGGLWQSWGGGGLEFADLPYRDTTTNTDLTENRLFSPNLSRWFTPDPLGGDVTNPQSLNRYAYVLNNPATLTDPTGLQGCSPASIGTANCTPQHASESNQTCTVDGIDTSCGGAYGLLGMGGAVQCPGNVCSGWGRDPYTGEETYLTFYAGAGGATGYLSMYDWTQGVNEVGGNFLSNAQYTAYILAAFSGGIEAQRVALAQAIAANSNVPYQKAYDSLNTENGHLQGGNYNFAATSADLNPTNVCGGDARCYGIHFVTDPNSGGWDVHLDTSNPWASPWGLLEHGFVDVLLGNSAYTVIPRPWP